MALACSPTRECSIPRWHRSVNHWAHDPLLRPWSSARSHRLWRPRRARRSLTSGPLRDRSGGGWHSVVATDGIALIDAKSSYDSSFVILAASSAKAAGVADSQRILDVVLSSIDQLWWEENSGMLLDLRHPLDGEADPYRGAATDMHTVEALLAALSATETRLPPRPGAVDHESGGLRVG